MLLLTSLSIFLIIESVKLSYHCTNQAVKDLAWLLFIWVKQAHKGLNFLLGNLCLSKLIPKCFVWFPRTRKESCAAVFELDLLWYLKEFSVTSMTSIQRAPSNSLLKHSRG